jgi:hypothetical protein
MTAADDEANRRHLAALIGSPDTRWREHLEREKQLVWSDVPDGRQAARAAPFRYKGRVLEIGGFYLIEGADGCFRVSYYPTLGDALGLAVTCTRDAAQHQASAHYQSLRAAATKAAPAPPQDEQPPAG